MSRHTLPRRTLLRGFLGGAAIALPLPRLAGMLNSNGTAYANGTPLKPRYLTWFFGNGIDAAQWVPAATGTGATLAGAIEIFPALGISLFRVKTAPVLP